MQQEYMKVADWVLSKIKHKEGQQAEVFIVNSQEMKVEVAQQKVENMLVASEAGLGLRVIVEGRLGYAFTSELSKPALELVLEQALANANETQPDQAWELPKAQGIYPQMDIYDGTTFTVPLEEKIELARNIETAARAYNERVKIIERAGYQEGQYRSNLFNSWGLQASFESSFCGGYAVAVGQEKGDSQTGFGMQYDWKYQSIDAARIGREAAHKAVRLLGAKRIASAILPVVLDPYTVTSFFSVLQTAFSADAVLKGRSFLEGCEQKQVAHSAVTIIDDGTLSFGLGTRPFDGEGIGTQETVLIKDGYLQGFLHNSYTAKRFGAHSTGNAIRGSFKSTPEVGISNFYIKAGTTPSEQMLGEISRGLYITDVMGMHTANPVSGDFSLGVSGLLIENGRLTSPVKGIAVAGNLKELLLDIDAVGNEVKFYINKGAPSVRIKSLSISGA